MTILVTGGTGFIGSHTCVDLMNEGHEVVIVDNLSNSKIDVVKKIEKITSKKVRFYENDLRDRDKIEYIFKKEKIDAVIHFAGLKAVGESVDNPLEYFDNNLISTIYLLEIMKKFSVNKLIFSSSATVYGNAKKMPLYEKSETGVLNPYGRTKLMIENMLLDYSKANKNMEIVILRYFNPVGAHKSGIIGEDPNGIPNNLMPIIMDVATKKREKVSIFGNDYNTKDGTGVRDYIHVCDLSKGHISALNHIKPGVNIYNLGTGNGYSVLEMIKTFEKVNNVKVNYEFAPRREGDIAECYANVDKAKTELNWESELTIEDMCRDAWRYVKHNEVKHENNK
ncbi:MAG: UDP-glucose 4-epimerase GalE [Bacilli bacterium]